MRAEGDHTLAKDKTYLYEIQSLVCIIVCVGEQKKVKQTGTQSTLTTHTRSICVPLFFLSGQKFVQSSPDNRTPSVIGRSVTLIHCQCHIILGHTEMGNMVGPRLRESCLLAPSGSGARVHAT